MLLHSPLRSPEQPWSIRCHLRAGGRNDVIRWYDKLTRRSQVAFRTRLQYLRFQPQGRWVRPNAAALKDHVCVIHFQDENRTQHRLTGYFDHAHHAFVICVIGVEKDKQYDPPDYEDRTHQCRTEVGDAFGQRTAEWPHEIY